MKDVLNPYKKKSQLIKNEHEGYRYDGDAQW